MFILFKAVSSIISKFLGPKKSKQKNVSNYIIDAYTVEDFEEIWNLISSK